MKANPWSALPAFLFGCTSWASLNLRRACAQQPTRYMPYSSHAFWYLTEEQWDYVLVTTTRLADETPSYERTLFIIACLKTLFLRISELSERKNWSPIMSHFWKDDEGNWWLKVFGKGRKLRDVTVPSEFLDYLSRYRRSRGASPLPSSSDDSPLVEKIRGQGGMTSRHLTRLVQEVFDKAYEEMKSDKGESASEKLKEASTHWLRHTGASMEVERGRALKDVSEDLGHSSMATTDTIYVQTENKKRAQSGKYRKVWVGLSKSCCQRKGVTNSVLLPVSHILTSLKMLSSIQKTLSPATRILPFPNGSFYSKITLPSMSKDQWLTQGFSIKYRVGCPKNSDFAFWGVGTITPNH